MDDTTNLFPPPTVALIESATDKLGFSMASDHQPGSLLRILASSKPTGRILELGTGTGLSAAWILDGMDVASSLISVDNDPQVVAIARQHLNEDP